MTHPVRLKLNQVFDSIAMDNTECFKVLLTLLLHLNISKLMSTCVAIRFESMELELALSSRCGQAKQ